MLNRNLAAALRTLATQHPDAAAVLTTAADRLTQLEAIPSGEDTATLAGVKSLLRDHLHDGIDCPACGRTARVYQRRLHHSMAAAAATLWSHAGTATVNAVELWNRTEGKNAAMLRHWGILQPGDEPGRWAVTELGARWIAGHCTVAAAALIYDGRCVGFTGGDLTFSDAIGAGFDLDELLAAQPFRLTTTPTDRLFDL